jgi:predicted dehydrogenase
MSDGQEGRTVRIAVAGLGKMGIMHASMIRAIPGAEVAALVEPNGALGKQVASMGVNAPCYPDIETCLREARPDGVIVSTPQFTHRAVAEACLAADVGVLTEKPLAHTLDEARAMVEAARRHPKAAAGVGYMLAHNPLYDEAARLVREGALGDVKSCRASCFLSQVFKPSQGWTFTKDKAGGGVVINSGSHLLYVMQKVMGHPTGVMARMTGVHNAIEDTFGALVDFASGAFGSIAISWSVPGYEFQTHDLMIEGTNGTIEVGNEVLRVWLVEDRGDYKRGWTERRRDETEPRAALSLSPDYCGDEFYLEDLDFVRAIAEGRQPKVGWEEGLRVQEFLDALYRSAESRTWVAIESPAS